MTKKVRPVIIVIENTKDVVFFGEGILKNINKGCFWRKNTFYHPFSTEWNFS